MAKLRKQETGFTQVKNEVLSDPKLSLRAKGLFAYLFSKPDGWQFAIDRMAKESTDGRASFMAGLRELESNKYLERRRLTSGRMEYILGFQITPHQEPQSEIPTVGNSHCGKIEPLSNTDSSSNTEGESNKDLPKGRGTSSRPSKKENEDVSYLIAAFKDALRSPQLDGTIGENRRYAYLCMTKFGGVVKVRDLIKAALGDDFHRERATGFKYLYYKGVELGQKSSVPYMKDYSKLAKNKNG